MRQRNRTLLGGAGLVLAALLFFFLCWQPRAAAWLNGGHKALTQAAVKSLPDDVPEFFRQAEAALSEMSTEPDRWKDITAPRLKTTEAPEHFIDLEYLEGQAIPPTRFDLTRHYVAKDCDLAKSGFLPYALIEGYERLMLAFRDYRSRPDSAAVRQRVIVYAGWLAHYASDAAMPLHTTKNFNGKPGGGQALTQKGIHEKIDGYPEKRFNAADLAEGLKAEDNVDVWPMIVKAIQDSHAQVERCYELDLEGGFDTAPDKGRPLMLDRARAGAKLTLDLWYSAWKNSAPDRATIRP
jgi:hypothetical protein